MGFDSRKREEEDSSVGVVAASHDGLHGRRRVGAGIAGLTTSLGLHRQGYRSLVLETADSLRMTGFGITTWDNAWKALDAVGIGDSLRQKHDLVHGVTTRCTISGLVTSEASHGAHEIRFGDRKNLLEALVNELPSRTIRYSSKVVSVEESGFFKLVHLIDGTILKTKVLIGCDGVNSVVGKWLGFKKPAFAGRSAFRGHADFQGSHGFEPKFLQFLGKGNRSGFLPLDGNSVYWFFTYTSCSKDKEMEENPAEMKKFVLSKLGKAPDKIVAVVDNTELDCIICNPIRFRHPWELLWGRISSGNVCVAGDALHPMTPDIGHGGCAALEDGVVLARCLGEALSSINKTMNGEKTTEEDEYKKIQEALAKYAKQRRWRSIMLISTSYMMGYLLQSHGKMLSFLRDKLLPAFLGLWLLKMAEFDCGKLNTS